MRSLSKLEIHELLAAAKAHRERDWLMILVTYNHALRNSETLAIQRDDIRDGFLNVKRLKGSLHTIQPLITDPDPLLNEALPLIEYADLFRE